MSPAAKSFSRAAKLLRESAEHCVSRQGLSLPQMIGPVSTEVANGQNDVDKMMPPSVQGSMGSA